MPARYQRIHKHKETQSLRATAEFMKPYPLKLQISGPTALWTRPDTGSSPAPQYPLRLERGEGRVRCRVQPTFSAVKGIFESVLRWKSVNVRPTEVEICAPVQFHRYTTNYGGPLRASDAMNKGASFQFYTVVLVNVCYRLYAQAEFAGHHDGTTWPPHAYHDVFNRALEAIPSPPRPGRGQGEVSNSSLCNVGPPAVPKPLLSGEGWFRPETRVCESENHELPTMLRMVFDQTENLSKN